VVQTSRTSSHSGPRSNRAGIGIGVGVGIGVSTPHKVHASLTCVTTTPVHRAVPVSITKWISSTGQWLADGANHALPYATLGQWGVLSKAQHCYAWLAWRVWHCLAIRSSDGAFEVSVRGPSRPIHALQLDSGASTCHFRCDIVRGTRSVRLVPGTHQTMARLTGVPAWLDSMCRVMSTSAEEVQ
jgi:hypothetical protein